MEREPDTTSGGIENWTIKLHTYKRLFCRSCQINSPCADYADDRLCTNCLKIQPENYTEYIGQLVTTSRLPKNKHLAGYVIGLLNKYAEISILLKRKMPAELQRPLKQLIEHTSSADHAILVIKKFTEEFEISTMPLSYVIELSAIKNYKENVKYMNLIFWHATADLNSVTAEKSEQLPRYVLCYHLNFGEKLSLSDLVSYILNSRKMYAF